MSAAPHAHYKPSPPLAPNKLRNAHLERGIILLTLVRYPFADTDHRATAHLVKAKDNSPTPLARWNPQSMATLYGRDEASAPHLRQPIPWIERDDDKSAKLRIAAQSMALV